MNSVCLFAVVLSALLQLIFAASSYYEFNGGEYGYPSAVVNGNGYSNGYNGAVNGNGNGYISAPMNGNGNGNGYVSPPMKNGNGYVSPPMNGKGAPYAAPAPAFPPYSNPPPSAAFSLGTPYGLQSYFYNPHATIYNTAKSYHREDVHQSETKVVPNHPKSGFKN